MTCQLCLANWSTRHVTQISPGGRSEDLYYCETCYEAKYLKPGPAVSDDLGQIKGREAGARTDVEDARSNRHTCSPQCLEHPRSPDSVLQSQTV